MYRHLSRPRQDWQKTVVAQGLVFPTTDLPDGTKAPYWNESAYYELSGEQVEELEAATERLHGMCVEAARFLASGEMGDLGLPAGALELAAASLAEAAPSLYGRFDLRYDGLGPAKLLEYNADTPTGLVETAVVQWYWLEDVMPSCDQWNSVHERLVNAWRAVRPRLPSSLVHFAHHDADDTGEEWMTVAYLRDTCVQAGYTTVGITVPDIGWDHAAQRFVDLDDRPMHVVCKLYPWEDMLWEEFGRHVAEHPHAATWIEPVWKVLLSNKTLLAALWHLYPDHENLLPAFLDGPGALTEWVAKPLHGREGDSIRIHTEEFDHAQPGGYGAEGWVYQQWAPLPDFDGNRAVLGSWVVDGKSAGLGVRESDGWITDYYARSLKERNPRPDPPSRRTVPNRCPLR